MKIDYTSEFEERYSELPQKVKTKEVWSFRIDKNYRIIFKFSDKNKVLFLNVGHHHWIYRINF